MIYKLLVGSNILIIIYQNCMLVQESIDKAKIYLFDGQSIPKQIMDIMEATEHSTVHIFGMQWKTIGINNHIHKIKQWDVPERLNISINKQSNILLSITHIKFPALKIINLDYNLIISLQGLSSIYMPCLEKISLNDNEITSVRALRTCFFPRLNKISLSGNRIIEFRYFQAIYAPNLRELIVDKDVSRVQGYDARWFMKIQPLGIFETLNIKSLKRIKQKSLEAQIQKKYPYIM